jgi:hypothetical protein
LTYFNTEAHPIDGASLECCRAMRNKEKKHLDESLDVLAYVNPENLVERYIRLNAARNPENLALLQPLSISKSMKDEYEEDRVAEKLEEEKAHSRLLLACQNKTRYQPVDSFGCSLNNTFRIYTSLFNSHTYFP